MAIPGELRDIADRKADIITGSLPRLFNSNQLTVLFIVAYSNSKQDAYVECANHGIIVVTHANLKANPDKQKNIIKLNSLADVRSSFYALGSYVKQVFKTPTIGITGSIGKTTTTLMLQSIFSQKNNVFVSGRNRNIAQPIVEQLITRWGPDYDYHIQETGGGAPTVVERSVNIIQPDAFCITNIYPHHLDKYGDIEGILYDKTSYDRTGNPNIFGVINIDDDKLRMFPFKCKIISCGIEHTEADYVASNIHQSGKWLTLDITHNEVTTSVRVNIPGIHNAYNALIAFAMAKEWGLSDDEIKQGFEAYQSGAIRQSLREVSGRLLYIDCFNVSVDSIKSCLKTLESIELPAKGRKIAVINGENALGAKAYSVNYSAGLEMSDYDIDEFIFVGPEPTASEEDFNFYGHGWAVYDGARRVVRKKPVSFISDLGALGDKLAAETEPGDIILFKGIFRMPLFGAIDRAFGTSYVIVDPNFPGKAIKDDGYRAYYYPPIDGANITACNQLSGHIAIPNTIEDKPVFRIGRLPFKGNKEIASIDFGRSLRCIGAHAFDGCDGLTELRLPSNIIHIEEGAFANCQNLRTVIFDGIEHIGKNAFQNCPNLASVELPQCCYTIEDDAFADCPNVQIIRHD